MQLWGRLSPLAPPPVAISATPAPGILGVPGADPAILLRLEGSAPALSLLARLEGSEPALPLLARLEGSGLELSLLTRWERPAAASSRLLCRGASGAAALSRLLRREASTRLASRPFGAACPEVLKDSGSAEMRATQ